MKYLLLISLSFILFLNVNAQYSREEAIEIIQEDVIGLDSLQGRYIYSKFDMLNQGDTIFLEYGWANYVNSFDEAWAFFIDDAPVANWMHPCRLIFYDVNSGEHIIINESYPPYPYFQDRHEYYDDWEWIVHNEVTRAEALDFVINEIIGPDSLEYKQLFSRYEELTYNDTLWMEEGEYYQFYSVYKAWVFFIDDLPIAYWSHPCRVVIVNTYPGYYNYYYSISEDDSPPVPYFENWNLFLEQWQWITTVDLEQSSTQESELSLFPNPCRNEMFIQYNVEPDLKLDIFITDITGKTINTITWKNQPEQFIINTSQLNNGLYFINIFENGELLLQEKFLKIE